jgi:hypothetical protein
LVVTFLFAALYTLRPRQAGEAVFYFFILGSPPILLAVDRANNDLVVYLLLLPLVPCLFHPRRWVRFVPIILIAMAGALKFYPVAAAVVLLLVGDKREIRARAALAAAILAVVAIDIIRDLTIVGPLFPRADGLTTFAALNLIEALGLHGRIATIVVAMLIVAVVLVVSGSRRTAGLRAQGEDSPATVQFGLGAVLLTACFFAGSNYAYRWIFALWMAPFLWRAPNDPALPGTIRSLSRVIRALVLVALWADPLASALLTRFIGRVDAETITHLADEFFLWEQPITWLLFLGLLAFVVLFVRDGLRRLLGRG